MTYDAIIIGARCAGAATALLLARKGHRVLLVDRATFPSDTLSTHLLKSLGVAALERFGVLQALLRKSDCPPITSLSVDYSDFSVEGKIPAFGGVGCDFCPRRIELDQLLIDAAAEAGAHFRDAFHADRLVWNGNRVCGIHAHTSTGQAVCESARIVIGADGFGSPLARAVGAVCSDERPPKACQYYTYWTDLPLQGGEIYLREGCAIAAFPTSGNATCVLVGRRANEFGAFHADVEGTYFKTIRLAPRFAERLSTAKRQAPFRGIAGRPSYVRKPFGEGWALVGDAGLYQDPFTAHGMTQAFLDAELLSVALARGFRGDAPMTVALAGYERERDEAARPMYEFTDQIAAFRMPSPKVNQLLRVVSGNPVHAGRFVGVIEGTVPSAEFFSIDNIQRILGFREERVCQ